MTDLDYRLECDSCDSVLPGPTEAELAKIVAKVESGKDYYDYPVPPCAECGCSYHRWVKYEPTLEEKERALGLRP